MVNMSKKKMRAMLGPNPYFPTIVGEPRDNWEDDDYILVDQGGFVMTMDEVMTYFAQVVSGTELVGDSQIEEHNRAIRRKHGLDLDASNFADRPAPKPKRTRRMASGFVYLMTNGDLFKIGVSKDVERRRREIENASGFPVEIVSSGFYDDMLGAELEFHDRYREMRRRGEWFELTPEQVASISDELERAER